MSESPILIEKTVQLRNVISVIKLDNKLYLERDLWMQHLANKLNEIQIDPPSGERGMTEPTVVESSNDPSDRTDSGLSSASTQMPGKPLSDEITDDEAETKTMLQENLLERLLSRLGHLPEPMKITPEDVTAVNEAVRDVLKSQPMLLEIEPPICIVGDLHGQFYDILRWFDFCGDPPSTRYLFLGDYVDRGQLGLESLCLLLLLKVKYPNDLWLLRGNHESSQVNVVYGFYDEMRKRFGPKLGMTLWHDFCHTYNYMPIAAVVGGKILCMHGGLSPDLQSLDQVRQLPRPCQVPDYGLMCDLVWADPINGDGWWENNRRISFSFGADVVKEACQRLGVELIVRGHQAVLTGYQFSAGGRVITVFSAPNNCCSETANDGAALSVDENLTCSVNIMRPDEALPLVYLPHGRMAKKEPKSGSIVL